MIPRQRQLYWDQQDAAQHFYEFHPEEFKVLTAEELELLDTYYFIKRPIDVDDVAEYAVNLQKADPSIRHRAETALRKVLLQFRLDEQSMQKLFPKAT